MRILLVSANREHFPEPVFPLSLAYLANALKTHGITVKIFDAGLHRFPLNKLRKELKSFKPDSVGLSLRNIDNAAYPHTQFYVPNYPSLVEAIRSCGPIRVVLGGSAFSIFPTELMRIIGADAGMIGEGESGIHVFIKNNVDTLYSSSSADLDHVSFPSDIDVIFPHFQSYKTIGIQTKRGCPNQCTYCTYPLIEGRRVRPRPPEAVAEEIALLKSKFFKRDFFIVDSLFNSDETHMARVLEIVIAKRLDITFSCYLKPSFADLSVFKLLKKAGCIAVDFGTDSGSAEMLQTLKKGFTAENVIESSNACREAGIEFCHSLIFGAPGENPKTINETVALMDYLRPRAVVAMTGVRIYPGTELAVRAQGEGYIYSGQSLLEPCFYFGGKPALSLIDEVYQRVAGRSNWFFPGGRNWSRAIGPRLLRLIKRKGPLWLRFKIQKHNTFGEGEIT